MNRSGIRRAFFATVAVLLAGCSTVDDLLGEREGPALPGSRIPVLLATDTAKPDPGISDLSVLLPRPLTNTAWPQQGGFDIDRGAEKVNY